MIGLLPIIVFVTACTCMEETIQSLPKQSLRYILPNTCILFSLSNSNPEWIFAAYTYWMVIILWCGFMFTMCSAGDPEVLFINTRLH